MSEKPHKAVINISIDIHPINNHGYLDGRVVNKGQYGIKNKLLVLEGSTLEECLEKVRKFINENCKLSKM